MNICLVLISDGWGGAEAVVYELTRHLWDKGENVSIILNQEMVKYYADLEGIKLCSIGPYPPKFEIPLIGRMSQKYNLPNRALSLLYSCSDELLPYWHYKRTRKEVTQFLSCHCIDVIHLHRTDTVRFVFDLLGDLKIPTIATLHGGPIVRASERVHPLMSPIRKWEARKVRRALSKIDKLTAVSTYELNWDIPLRDKSIVIYNGIDLSEIQNRLKTTLKLKGGFNLLFPGGAKWNKGGDLLISALAKVSQEIPDTHLYIALNVPQNHMLRKMVTNLGLERNITFAGFLPLEEYRRLLNSVDVLAMPSRAEPFGIVYLEAMALGKPIIAGNTGGAPEVVKNGRNGILVEPEPSQIAEAILYLYRNENIRKEMSQNNLQDVARFDWNLITDQYIRLYKEMLETNEQRE